MKRLYLTIIVVYCILLEESAPRSRLRHNHKTISKCIKCPPGWGVSRHCTVDVNTECERCTEGKTYSPHYSYKSTCWSCSKCGVGLYEAHSCTAIRDTICDDCTRIIQQPEIIRNNDFTQKCSYLYMN